MCCLCCFSCCEITANGYNEYEFASEDNVVRGALCLALLNLTCTSGPRLYCAFVWLYPERTIREDNEANLLLHVSLYLYRSFLARNVVPSHCALCVYHSGRSLWFGRCSRKRSRGTSSAGRGLKPRVAHAADWLSPRPWPQALSRPHWCSPPHWSHSLSPSPGLTHPSVCSHGTFFNNSLSGSIFVHVSHCSCTSRVSLLRLFSAIL